MSPLSKALAALVALALGEKRLQAPSTVDPTTACDIYLVNDVPGGFTERVFVDFSGVTPGINVSALLSSNGLADYSYQVKSEPFSYTLTPSNILAGDGALNLKVSAYTGSGPVQGAVMGTQDRFRYASVRTVQKSSKTPGVVEGNFFYRNDNQEIDWEILTSTIWNRSECVLSGIWAVNQAVTPGQSSTSERIPFTFDPTADFHEYRIDVRSPTGHKELHQELTIFVSSGRLGLQPSISTANGKHASRQMSLRKLARGSGTRGATGTPAGPTDLPPQIP
ncbi:hypothetical protein D9756_007716 [Leucocoprinus leucothites]|uniref:GH16 domain-containing protein n=1 Tax=Leucocoprinus leucothites TaxID=201217 RepID=A0A8H5D150_9AGAR|nr:hypothetical protein D9756_007716 [Leucoagaricus leucothites]